MGHRLNLILIGGLLWAASGCCCYDQCCNYGGCGYNYSACNYGCNYGYNYGAGYNTVSTGGYNTTPTTAQVPAYTTAQNNTSSSFIAGKHSKHKATAGSMNNYAPNSYVPNNNGMNGYAMQGGMVPPQNYAGTGMEYGSPCPCESSEFPMETYMQDANGMAMPMEGMVYDASNMPMPLMTAPSTIESTETNSGLPKPGELIPATQPQIGFPTTTDGRPLVPPAPEP